MPDGQIGVQAFELLEDCTCQNLRQATRVVTQFFEKILEPTGLKVTQLPVLAAAADHGPVSMSRLADLLIMDRTTLTRNLQPLERAGLITIQKGEDRRSRLVSATRDGQDALQQALPLWRQAQETLVDSLGRFQWAVLMENLHATVGATKAE